MVAHDELLSEGWANSEDCVTVIYAHCREEHPDLAEAAPHAVHLWIAHKRLHAGDEQPSPGVVLYHPHM